VSLLLFRPLLPLAPLPILVLWLLFGRCNYLRIEI
jgi:hypothetical protein